LHRIKSVNLDAIILDVNLGGENGLLLMDLLKEKNRKVPILVYSGMDHDQQAVRTMLRQGAHHYLRKGSMSELCETLSSMMN